MSAMENKEGKKKKNIFSPIAKYFREVKSELKKVVFPTAKQTRINTTVVIVVVIIVGIIIGVLDLAFNYARNAIINRETTQTEQTVPADLNNVVMPDVDVTDVESNGTEEAAPEAEPTSEGTVAPEAEPTSEGTVAPDAESTSESTVAPDAENGTQTPEGGNE